MTLLALDVKAASELNAYVVVDPTSTRDPTPTALCCGLLRRVSIVAQPLVVLHEHEKPLIRLSQSLFLLYSSSSSNRRRSHCTARRR